MDKNLKCTRQLSFITTFLAFLITSGQAICRMTKFVAELHVRVNLISKLNIDHELRGHLLLRHANLDGHDQNLIVGAAGG